MKITSALAKGCLILLLLAVFAASAQQKPGSKVAPKYDFETEVTVRGTVIAVSDHPCPISRGTGTHLMLKTAEGLLEVHLGQAAFLQAYDLHFSTGDQIEVTGSHLVYEGHEALLARQIVRGDEVFVFRDPKGKPVW